MPEGTENVALEGQGGRLTSEEKQETSNGELSMKRKSSDTVQRSCRYKESVENDVGMIFFYLP